MAIPLALAAAVTSSAASIYGGYSAYQSAKKQASLMEDQGLLQREDYYRQAAITRDDGQRLRAQQAMEYISSGVEIQGTPLLVLAETAKLAETEAKYLERTGQAISDLANANAKITRKEGKSQFLSSILQGTSNIMKVVK